MKQKLRARFARLAPIRDVARVFSGSPEAIAAQTSTYPNRKLVRGWFREAKQNS